MLHKSTSILVTGGEGFVGKRVVARLHDLGCLNVFSVRHEKYDLTEQSDVRKLFATVRPEVVIHLAAKVGGIGVNQKLPGEYFYENLIMGAMLQEEARLSGVRKFVSIGTICSYPKFTPTPFREEDLWNGYPEETNAPYGLAKKMLLTQAQAYRQQYGVDSIFLLPVNIYGPGDNFDPETSHVIPAMVRRFLTAKRQASGQVVLWGDGAATREFLYVDDAASGIVAATDKYSGGEPVNLGTGAEISIKKLAEKIADLTGFRGEICWDTDKPNGQPRRLLDVSRAREFFDFVGTTELDDGLRLTVKWYESQMVFQ